MNILCTMPGRHGDILWALPTVRAISETYGVPVDLCLSAKYGSLKDLIQRQEYTREVYVHEGWEIRESAPIQPRIPPHSEAIGQPTYDQIFHLGYEGWPTPDLPRDIYGRAAGRILDQRLTPLDLDRPWITAPWPLPESLFTVGFTDEWFELKYGLYWLLRNAFSKDTGSYTIVPITSSPRWQTEAGHTACDWETAASWIATSQIFVGCCSALHVLARAVGKPVICVEPNPQRHQDLFYPYGKTGSVQLVLGNDGQPTFDSRHLIDAIQAKLQEIPVHA